MRASNTLYGYFVLDTDVLDGPAMLAPETVLTDISGDVRAVSTNRGKQRDLDEYMMGTAGVELNNQNRKYDPTNTASPYYGNIAPMRTVHVTAVLNGIDYPLFRGYVETWGVDYSTPNLPLASIAAGDAFLLFSRSELTAIAAAHSGDLAGERIERVLDLPEVAFPVDIRDLDVGEVTFGPTTFNETGPAALGYLQRAARSEDGALFVSKEGDLTFRERNTAPGANAATFSDDGAAGSIRYLTVDQTTGTDLLYNRVKASGTSTVEQVVEDTASQSDNLVVATLDRLGELTLDDAVVLDQARVVLAKYATVETRLRQVQVATQSLSATRQAELLALELGARVTVTRTPPGGGTPSTISQAAIVTGISHSISRGGRDWITTLTFAAGKRAIGFVLDDVDLGQLDDDFLAA